MSNASYQGDRLLIQDYASARDAAAEHIGEPEVSLAVNVPRHKVVATVVNCLHRHLPKRMSRDLDGRSENDSCARDPDSIGTSVTVFVCPAPVMPSDQKICAVG